MTIRKTVTAWMARVTRTTLPTQTRALKTSVSLRMSLSPSALKIVSKVKMKIMTNQRASVENKRSTL